MMHVKGRAGGATQHDVGGLEGPESTQRMALDNILNAPGIRVNAAVFNPCSRTAWHSHTEGQLILVQHGQGVVVTDEGASHASAGDVIYAPPGEAHWHGAAPDSFFVYTVVSLGETEWLDRGVADDDYFAVFDQDANGMLPT